MLLSEDIRRCWFASIVDGPEELVMAQEVIWEKSRWNWEFWLNVISFRKILRWSGSSTLL